MKRRIISAALLLICFCFLAVLTGAIPVTTEARASSGEAAADPEDFPGGEPDPEASPVPTEDPEADSEPAPPPETAEPVPETAVPAPEPAPEKIEPPEVTAPEDIPPRLVTTTIPADELLDNDTYYELDARELLSEGVSFSLPPEGYQILILHTHTTEAYTRSEDDWYDTDDPYHSLDPAHSVVKVGDVLAEALSAYGLNVLHDTTVYDHPSYTGSYSRSGEGAAALLEAWPGIRLVIDLHRDALGDEDVIYRTAADIDGADAAQLMLVVGSDLNMEHPNWTDNLRLALTLQEVVRERYPSLMRPVSLSGYRYNQQLCPGSLLLEVGTAGNTLAQATEAVRLFAEAAGPVIASWIGD